MPRLLVAGRPAHGLRSPDASHAPRTGAADNRGSFHEVRCLPRINRPRPGWTRALRSRARTGKCASSGPPPAGRRGGAVTTTTVLSRKRSPRGGVYLGFVPAGRSPRDRGTESLARPGRRPFAPARGSRAAPARADHGSRAPVIPTAGAAARSSDRAATFLRGRRVATRTTASPRSLELLTPPAPRPPPSSAPRGSRSRGSGTRRGPAR